MSSEALIFLTGLSVAIGAALLGIFVIFRRMALVVDSLSHVALPGLALGLLYEFNPFWGALLALVAAVFIILFIEERTGLATETVVGILFVTALAIGTILTPEEDILEALFGSLEKVSSFDFWLALGGVGIVTFLVFYFFPAFIRMSVSRELAQAEGLSARRLHILFLLLFALLIAVGVKIAGSLLMGALIILPAATAKNLTRTIKSLAFLSIILATLGVLAGLYLSSSFALPPGPMIILVNVVFFLATLLLKR